MPARTSKEVTDRQRSCQFILTALSEHGAKVSDLLSSKVGPDLGEGDAEPGFSSVINALSRHLGASAGRLVERDEAVYAANARLSRLRDERSEQSPVWRV